jgi:hypothetical protein
MTGNRRRKQDLGGVRRSQGSETRGASRSEVRAEFAPPFGQSAATIGDPKAICRAIDITN